MADFNFNDGLLHKVFLAGVGALATTVEKSQEIVDDLVKKGEITVEPVSYTHLRAHET